MAGELKLSFIIEAIDRATATVRNITQAVSRPARAVASIAAGAGAAIDKLASSYAGIAGAIGGGLELKGIVDEDAMIRRLAAVTNTPLAVMNELNDRALEVAKNMRVSHDEMLQAFDAFRLGGGDAKSFDANLESVAATIALLGGNGKEAGDILATLRRSLALTTPDQLNKALAVTVAQLGNVRGGIETYAMLLPELAANYANVVGGKHGIEDPESGMAALRQLNSVYYAIAQTSHSSRGAWSVLGDLLERLEDPMSRMRFTGATGIATEAGGKVRPITDIIRDIAKSAQTQMGQMLLSNVGFSPETVGALRAMNPDMLNQVLNMPADTADFMQRASQSTAGLTGALTKLDDTIKQIAESRLLPWINRLADALNAANGLVGAMVAGLGGLVIGAQAVKWVAELTKYFGIWRGIGTIAAMIGDFTIALRAGYGAVAAFNLVLAANPIGVVLAAIALLVAAAYEIYEHWDWLKGKLAAIWQAIAGVFEAAWAKIKPIIEPIIKATEFVAKLPQQAAGAGGGMRIDPFTGIPIPTIPSGSGAGFDALNKAEVGGEINIKIETEKGLKATPTKVTKKEGSPDLTVYTGYGVAGFAGGM